MSGLAEAIRRCNLPLKLDNDTEGYGNCFPNESYNNAGDLK